MEAACRGTILALCALLCSCAELTHKRTPSAALAQLQTTAKEACFAATACVVRYVVDNAPSDIGAHDLINAGAISCEYNFIAQQNAAYDYLEARFAKPLKPTNHQGLAALATQARLDCLTDTKETALLAVVKARNTGDR